MPSIPHFVYQLFLLTYYYIETIVLINLFFLRIRNFKMNTNLKYLLPEGSVLVKAMIASTNTIKDMFNLHREPVAHIIDENMFDLFFYYVQWLPVNVIEHQNEIGSIVEAVYSDFTENNPDLTYTQEEQDELYAFFSAFLTDFSIYLSKLGVLDYANSFDDSYVSVVAFEKDAAILYVIHMLDGSIPEWSYLQ